MGDAPGTKSELLPVHCSPGLAWQLPCKPLPLVTCGCWNKLPKTFYLKTTELSPFWRPEAQTHYHWAKARGRASVSVGGGGGGTLPGENPVSPSSWWLHHSNPCLHGQGGFSAACASACPLPPLTGTPAMPSRIHLDLSSLDPSLSHICKVRLCHLR